MLMPSVPHNDEWSRSYTCYKQPEIVRQAKINLLTRELWNTYELVTCRRCLVNFLCGDPNDESPPLSLSLSPSPSPLPYACIAARVASLLFHISDCTPSLPRMEITYSVTHSCGRGLWLD